VTAPWLERVASLLAAPSPAVLTTYRRDGSALVSPVWFRFERGAFEVVVADGDVKLRHLRRDPRCGFLAFETAPPFRGIEAHGPAELDELDVAPVRAAIAARYLGAEAGARFAEARSSVPGVVVRIPAATPRVWDLAAILPAGGPPASA
jgi:PPOX class probable F420-dependent enzyme